MDNYTPMDVDCEYAAVEYTWKSYPMDVDPPFQPSSLSQETHIPFYAPVFAFTPTAASTPNPFSFGFSPATPPRARAQSSKKRTTRSSTRSPSPCRKPDLFDEKLGLSPKHMVYSLSLANFEAPLEDIEWTCRGQKLV